MSSGQQHWAYTLEEESRCEAKAELEKDADRLNINAVALAALRDLKIVFNREINNIPYGSANKIKMP